MKVNEIFYSIQGEGHRVGTPVIFIRLSGCNLSCGYCDTDHSSYTEMDVQQIMVSIKKYRCKNVIITGGEPLIQDIEPLTYQLKLSGYHIALETNGTKHLNDVEVDWLTLSPKGKTVLTFADELKMIWGEPIPDGVFSFYKYMQPKHGEDIAPVMEFVKQHPDWRLSTQAHKTWGAR